MTMYISRYNKFDKGGNFSNLGDFWINYYESNGHKLSEYQKEQIRKNPSLHGMIVSSGKLNIPKVGTKKINENNESGDEEFPIDENVKLQETFTNGINDLIETINKQNKEKTDRLNTFFEILGSMQETPEERQEKIRQEKEKEIAEERQKQLQAEQERKNLELQAEQNEKQMLMSMIPTHTPLPKMRRMGSLPMHQTGGWFSPNYLKTVAKIESQGDYHRRNSSGSSAYGAYQFLNSTWNLLNNKYGNNSWNIKNPAHQDLAMKHFTMENAKYLKSKGIPVTDANLYMMHHLGSGGFSKLWSQLNKNPNAPLRTIATSKKVIEQNPLFRTNMTVGQFYDNYAKKFNKNIAGNHSPFDNNTSTNNSPVVNDLSNIYSLLSTYTTLANNISQNSKDFEMGMALNEAKKKYMTPEEKAEMKKAENEIQSERNITNQLIADNQKFASEVLSRQDELNNFASMFPEHKAVTNIQTAKMGGEIRTILSNFFNNRK